MTAPQLLWHTDADNCLAAEANGYRITVERLLPAVEARFILWSLTSPRQILGSGIRDSVTLAVVAAEEVVGRMPDLSSIHKGA